MYMQEVEEPVNALSISLLHAVTSHMYMQVVREPVNDAVLCNNQL